MELHLFRLISRYLTQIIWVLIWVSIFHLNCRTSARHVNFGEILPCWLPCGLRLSTCTVCENLNRIVAISNAISNVMKIAQRNVETVTQTVRQWEMLQMRNIPEEECSYSNRFYSLHHILLSNFTQQFRLYLILLPIQRCGFVARHWLKRLLSGMLFGEFSVYRSFCLAESMNFVENFA